MKPVWPSVVLLAAATLACAAPARSQVHASERGSVSQTVDGTVITVDYGRPQLRGRDSVFGKVVTPDQTWTPGANQSTTLQVSRDVQIGGRPLPAGKYSVWLTMAPNDWRLHLHRDATLFHTRPPRLADMLLSVPVTPRQGESVEVLTFDFPRVSPIGTELRLRWGTTIVSLDIRVQPNRATRATTPAQLARDRQPM